MTERTTFAHLGLIDPILKALQEEGYTHPTPIQEQAIPHLLNGRDLLGCAQTGTGKTAAFAIPILQRATTREREPGRGPRPVRTLVLTPTRELAIQIGDSFAAYGRHLDQRHTVIFGGVGQKPQTDALQRGVDILVATPGRLLDLMGQGFVKLDQLDVFVLDEADRMLDMGFIHDVRKVIAKLPTDRQTLLFSATMPPEIAKLANTILRDPVKVEVTPVSSTAETIDQKMYFVDRQDKNDLLVHVLQDPAIREALVFTRTKHGANKVAKVLLKHGITAEAIHGNKSQSARQAALKNFKEGRTRVLVATDIAARGIDIDGLGHVINFDIPNVPETYVHRIGRTGRAGAEGRALSFCDHEEKEYLRDITRLIKREIPVVEDHPFVMTGPPKRKPAPEPREGREPRAGGRGRGRGQGQGRTQAPARAPREAHEARPTAGDAAPVEGTAAAKEGRSRRRRRRGGRGAGERSGQSGPNGSAGSPATSGDRPGAERRRSGRASGKDNAEGRTDRPAQADSERPRNDRPKGGRPKADRAQGEQRRNDPAKTDRPKSDRRPAPAEKDPVFRELFDDAKLVQRSERREEEKKKGSLLSRLFGI